MGKAKEGATVSVFFPLCACHTAFTLMTNTTISFISCLTIANCLLTGNALTFLKSRIHFESLWLLVSLSQENNLPDSRQLSVGCSRGKRMLQVQVEERSKDYLQTASDLIFFFFFYIPGTTDQKQKVEEEKSFWAFLQGKCSHSTRGKGNSDIMAMKISKTVCSGNRACGSGCGLRLACWVWG